MTVWRRTRLKYLASGKAGTWGSEPGEAAADVYCIRAADFDRNRFRVSPERLPLRSVDTAVFRELALQPGDLVLEKSGGGADQPVGGSVLFDLDVPAICSNFAMRLRPLAETDPRFLTYLMAAAYFRGVTASLTKQTTGIANLDVSGYMATSWRVPDAAAQCEIADYLDAETARIDAIVTRRTRQRKVLDEREFSLLSSVLVPEGADFVPLRHRATIQSGLTVEAHRDPGPDPVVRPYLRVANVQLGWLSLDSVTDITVPRTLADRCTLRAGDVLMTEGGDLDKLGRGTLWRGELAGALHQNHVFAVRPNPVLLSPEYLALLSRTAHARAYFESTGTRTTNLASTNREKILALPVPVLPLDVQDGLVIRANHDLGSIAQFKSCFDSQIALLLERRQALITAAVTGQLEIPGVAA